MSILTLPDVADASRRWLAEIEADDPELHAELAQTLLIEVKTDAEGAGPRLAAFPGVSAVLARLDIAGKDIGAFRCAPQAEGDGQTARLMAFDARCRAAFDVAGDLLFVGDYGAALVVATTEGVALLEGQMPDLSLVAVAADFEAFVIAQAYAYDAYKRHIVDGAGGETAYRAAITTPALADLASRADLATLFDAQLRA